MEKKWSDRQKWPRLAKKWFFILPLPHRNRVKLVEHGMHFYLEELERGRSKIGADDKGEKREMIRNLAFVNWPPTSWSRLYVLAYGDEIVSFRLLQKLLSMARIAHFTKVRIITFSSFPIYINISTFMPVCLGYSLSFHTSYFRIS